MSRLTPTSTRPSGHHGSSLPPRAGGGDDGRGRDGDMPDSIPNYGERLRRARMGLALAMTPIVVLFITFSAVYIARRAFPAADLNLNLKLDTFSPGFRFGCLGQCCWSTRLCSS